MAKVYKILIILLITFEVFAQSTPSGYTTNYRLRKWAQKANPSADSLNQNWIDIDTYLKALAVADTGKINSTGLDYYYGRLLFSNYSVLQVPLFEQAMIYPRSLRGDSNGLYYEKVGTDEPIDIDTLASYSYLRAKYIDTTGVIHRATKDTVETKSYARGKYLDTVNAITKGTTQVVSGSKHNTGAQYFSNLNLSECNPTISAGAITITSNFAEITITGNTDLSTINGEGNGKILIIVNASDYNLTLKNNSGNLCLPADVVLGQYDTAILFYSATLTRWLLISTSNNNYSSM